MISAAQPFFSVVIPVFNRAYLLAKTVASVLHQVDQDFEIIVVDDGSDDDPSSVLSVFGNYDIRFISQPNRGASAARNVGIDAARGQYIAFLDSDDVYLPHHLSSIRSVLERHPLASVYSQIIADRGGGNRFVKPPRAIRPDEHMAEYLMCDRGFVQTSGLCVPADLARQVRYREDASFGDDTDFAIRLHLAGCKFIMTPRPTVIWADDSNHARLSDLRRPLTQLGWLDDLKGQIPARAYHAYRGWHLAKSLVHTHLFHALRLFAIAVLNGAYPPRLAALILMQIILPNRVYRGFTDSWIKLRRRRVGKASAI